MIQTEQVYDIKENMLERDKVIKLPREIKMFKNNYKVDPRSILDQRKTDLRRDAWDRDYMSLIG